MPDLDDLRFIRTFTFEHIPPKLFERTGELSTEEIDRIYQLGSAIGASPLTLLYVLIDEVNVIHGVLWGHINIIEATIYVRYYAVDPEYEGENGTLVVAGLRKARDFLFNLPTGPALKKVIHFTTTRPGAWEAAGCKRSKRTLMEITNKTDRDRTPAKGDNA